MSTTGAAVRRDGPPAAQRRPHLERDLTLDAETSPRPGDGDAERLVDVLEGMSVGYASLDASWRIISVNAEVERAVGRGRRELVGTVAWELFPAAVGTEFESRYRQALSDGEPVSFDAYYPEPLNAWYQVRATPQGDGLALYFLDVTVRHRAEQVAEQLAGLSRLALALTAVRDVRHLVASLVERAMPLLGCDGGAVAVTDPDDDQVLRCWTAGAAGVTDEDARLPRTAHLPWAEASRTGASVLVPGRDAPGAYSEELAQVSRLTGAQAWASLPLRAGDSVLGAVTLGWERAQQFGPEQTVLLEAVAAQCAQALDRLQVLEAERASARRVARMGEALQRSLLTELTEPDHLELVARYVAAADEAQVGGDWYDAFMVGDGMTCLVVGDVMGHDQSAAVQMAQVRNVLRGVSHCIVDPPAAILSGLDSAMHDLALGVTATTVFATIQQEPADRASGLRTLHWSNAGHPAPLMVHPDGRAEYLLRDPDLLLGLDPTTDRHDHTQVLEPGSTVLFFTDGLVERRGENLDEGLGRLQEASSTLAHLALPQLCDELLARFGSGVEDDVALLAVRAHREDRPRPPEAGPGRLPADIARDAAEGPAAVAI